MNTEMAPAPSPDIAIVGVGGGGCNTVHRLSLMRLGTARRIAVNTDREGLARSAAETRILIGKEPVPVNGAGGDIAAGEQWAEQSRKELADAIGTPTVLFVCVALGGGTGTGAAPVIARLGREAMAQVIVTAYTPFASESSRRNKTAQAGLEALRGIADRVLVLPNDLLVEFAGELPLAQAFRIQDTIVADLIRTVIEDITLPAKLKEHGAEAGIAVPHYEIVQEQAAARSIDQLATEIIHVNYGSAIGILASGGESAAARAALGVAVRDQLQKIVAASAPSNVRMGPPPVPGPDQSGAVIDRTPSTSTAGGPFPPLFPPPPVPQSPKPEAPPVTSPQSPERENAQRIRPSSQSRLDDLW